MVSLSKVIRISVFVLLPWFFLFTTEVNSTLSKKKKEKAAKLLNRPEGVAYNNKKFPTRCHVCRLMVEEIKKSMKEGDKDLTEEEIKLKKRKDRRKTKAEKKREKNMPILVAIEEVCDKMLEYIPQEEDKSKFRYVKKKDLRETKSLIMSQKESEDASNLLSEKYDKFQHPETSRIMSLCDEIINTYENDLLNWHTMEEKEDLLDYFCKKRVFENEEEISQDCLNQITIKDDLWTKAFDAIFEKHPELKNQEF